jgi:hypothetical protein
MDDIQLKELWMGKANFLEKELAVKSKELEAALSRIGPLESVLRLCSMHLLVRPEARLAESEKVLRDMIASVLDKDYET